MLAWGPSHSISIERPGPMCRQPTHTQELAAPRPGPVSHVTTLQCRSSGELINCVNPIAVVLHFM